MLLPRLVINYIGNLEILRKRTNTCKVNGTRAGWILIPEILSLNMHIKRESSCFVGHVPGNCLAI